MGIRVRALIIFFLVTGSSLATAAEGLPVSFGIESDLRSQYFTYGVPYTDGAVWQPSAWIEWKNLGFKAWGNMVLNDERDQGKFNEIDLSLYYNWKVIGFTIRPYFVSFLYPLTNKNSLNYSSFSDIVPALYIDYNAGPITVFADAQLYAHPEPGSFRGESGLIFTEELPLKFKVNMSGLVGFGSSKYNKAVFNIDETALMYFTYNLDFPWEPVKGLIVKPNAHVTAYFQQKFRDATSYPTPLWGGIDLIYSF